jgi:hypothetical protein
MTLRTVRYLKAVMLFEQKKFDESMELFSSVSATPGVVIGLFPQVIAGQWSQQDESEESDIVSETRDIETPSAASAIPDGLRSSLDSARRSKDGESDTSSIISKHTEISNGPLG